MARPHTPPPSLAAARVVKWGKFWSLEPLFADERHYLVSRSGRAPRQDDIVLAVPAKGNRMRIVEVLGTSADLDAVLKALLYAERVAQSFPDAVLAEAAAVATRAEARDDDRRDLAELATFTIDPDTARDFDDAISVRRDGDGYRAWVHIADVSHFVDSDGAIDGEARRRTASVYLPLWAEPMLPEALSTDLCSLKPGVPRKCVTVEFTFDAAAQRTGVEFYRSTIVSDRRLTYGFVDEVLAGGGEDDSGVREHLLLAAGLAGKLRQRRFARGALQIGSFEPEYRFDTGGRMVGAVERPESPSHALVEEFMLAANEAVAGFLLARGAAALYRVHEAPEPAAVGALLEMIEELDVATPPFPEAEAANAADVTGALRRLSGTLPKVSAREKRGRLAFPQLLLRSLKQARYDSRNLGHFGLASDGYLHFTSPIRRYPDLVVHRALLHRLGLGGHELGPGELVDVAASCSLLERTIAKLELRADDVALAFLLERRLLEEGWDQIFEGEIIGLIESGLFVHFGGSFEGYLPARRLPGDYFAISRMGTALVGRDSGRRFRLGDRVAVSVNRVDRLSGKVDLDLAGSGEDARGADGRGEGGRPQRGRGRPPSPPTRGQSLTRRGRRR